MSRRQPIAVSQPSTTHKVWLAHYGEELARDLAAIKRVDRKKVELDIQARTLDLKLAKKYARNRPTLWKKLEEIGVSETAWCKTQGKRNSLSRMRRRLQLLRPRAFQNYLRNRRQIGDNGVYGLEYAVFLSKKDPDEIATDARQPTRVECDDRTLDPEWMALITADSTPKMYKMPPESVHVICTSFPYWPARRIYDPDGRPIGIGFEPTWEEYCDNMVHNVGGAMKHVLRDDGVLWVVMDDAIAAPEKEAIIQTNRRNNKPAKLATQAGFRVQDTTYLRPEGNWLMLPHRYAMAMQNAGWYLRDQIIIDTGAQGRKESSETRTRHSYVWLFMFTKTRDYYYDQDALRIPLTQDLLIGESGIRGNPFDYRAMCNPMGRTCDAVWHLPGHYSGDHPASFSEELARRCLSVSCPPGGQVLDPFCGSGSTAVAAAKLEMRFIGIDLNPKYNEEAKQRVLAVQNQRIEPTAERDPGAANDNLPAGMRAGD
jgi:DNA modification methylase